MTEFSLEQFFWEKLSQSEKQAYALFSIPVWFDSDLSEELLNKIDTVKAIDIEKVKQNFTMVHRYEAKGFYLNNKLRNFLLNKLENFFPINVVNEIHSFLRLYYLEKKDSAFSSYGGKKLKYLSFYHAIQEDPDEEIGRASCRERVLRLV